MALFGNKKEKEIKKEASATKEVKAVSVKKETMVVAKRDISNVIRSPRITEKAAIVSDIANCYTFNIAPEASKEEVKKAIKKLYKVTPVKVNITKIAPKKVQVRGKRGKFGIKSGGKKAVVYLKKGDNIQFV